VQKKNRLVKWAYGVVNRHAVREKKTAKTRPVVNKPRQRVKRKKKKTEGPRKERNIKVSDTKKKNKTGDQEEERTPREARITWLEKNIKRRERGKKKKKKKRGEKRARWQTQKT